MMWKEMVVAYFEVLFLQLSGGAEEDHWNHVRRVDGGVLAGQWGRSA
jgi:hypothetical protein